MNPRPRNSAPAGPPWELPAEPSPRLPEQAAPGPEQPRPVPEQGRPAPQRARGAPERGRPAAEQGRPQPRPAPEPPHSAPRTLPPSPRTAPASHRARPGQPPNGPRPAPQRTRPAAEQARSARPGISPSRLNRPGQPPNGPAQLPMRPGQPLNGPRPAPGQARPARAEPSQSRQARRGNWPSSRPEAETVMLPAFKIQPDTAMRPGLDDAVAGGTLAGDEPLARTGVATTPRRGRHGSGSTRFPESSRRRKWVSRAVLLAILAVQAVLTLRMQNTAFADEALYLTAGHLESPICCTGCRSRATTTRSSPARPFCTRSSARSPTRRRAGRRQAVSLLAMLATTALLYSLTRRLFNERVGLCAAVIFSVTESAIFLGNFATYDAPALCSCSLWRRGSRCVRRRFRWPVYLLAAPVAHSPSAPSTPQCCSCPPSSCWPGSPRGRTADAGPSSPRWRWPLPWPRCSRRRCIWPGTTTCWR